MPREFRTQESYIAEKITRDMISPFLRERGFRAIEDERDSHGKNQSQAIHSIDPGGRPMAMKVRLCWRQRDRSEQTFAAAQLLARIEGGDWIGRLSQKVEREKRDGTTHLLVVQRVGNALVHAAALPIDSVVPIWTAQRDASQRLIDEGKLGRRKKNHAMNGVSPTLYLREDAAPEVADALWSHPGVSDLAKLPLIETQMIAGIENDSVDDLPGFDYSAIGNDGAQRVQRMTSGVPRDPAVRRAVIERSRGACERVGCGARRDYPGFLDVHHILGAETSDRAWTCVALCPNCHREAHAAPDRDLINGELLKFAAQFEPVAGVPVADAETAR